MSLVEEAENNGFKEVNFISAIASRFKSNPLSVRKVGVHNPEELFKRFDERSTIWFIIDDIDQNFENTALFRMRVSSLFTSVRDIAGKIPAFRFRLAIRPNVW
ncbi:MAG: hypothetical protein AABZ60_00920, partial [Planctomycetota bacterium]